MYNRFELKTLNVNSKTLNIKIVLEMNSGKRIYFAVDIYDRKTQSAIEPLKIAFE